MIDDRQVTQARIDALYAAYRELQKDSKPRPDDYESLPPWRYGERSKDRVAAVKRALLEVQDEIIALEHSLRDPEQDAEMRAEINASIAMSGNWDDNASDYMHTPMQERLFQEEIERQVDLEYMNEMGYDYWSGPCQVCGGLTDNDNIYFVMGYDTCQHCYEDAVAWLSFVGYVTHHLMQESGRYGMEFTLRYDDED